MKQQIHYDEAEQKWYRFCPVCNKKVYHSTKRSGEVCIKNSKSCLQCLPSLTKCSICGKHGHTKMFHNPIPTEKVCGICKKLLPTTKDFYYQKRTPNGKKYYAPFCKMCDVENQKQRFNSSPEKRAIILWNSAKGTCKRKNMRFSLTIEDIMKQYHTQNGKCFYSGQLMSPIAKSSTLMSIDRIDSSEGYTKDNIVLCCWRINEMKKNDPQNNFLSLCKQIYDFSNNRHF